GARVCAVRADGGAGDAVLPARPAAAQPGTDGRVRAERLAGAAQPLLRGVPADWNGDLAGVGEVPLARGAARGWRARAGRRRAAPADLSARRARHAMDRRMGAVEPPAGDPPVLPHRLLRRGAGTWDRAAGGAADS